MADPKNLNLEKLAEGNVNATAADVHAVGVQMAALQMAGLTTRATYRLDSRGVRIAADRKPRSINAAAEDRHR